MNSHIQLSYAANVISPKTLVLAALLSLLILTISSSAGSEDGIFDNSSIDRSDLDTCVRCHNDEFGNAPINRNRCQSCHREAHGLVDGKPGTFSNKGKEHIHDYHSDSEFSQRGGCSKCHTNPSCSRCHQAHSQETKECDNCHGTLPFASGHSNEYEWLSASKHSWMNCNTCHVAEGLHFKEVRFSFNASNEMCGICHSKQVKSGYHYEADINCAGCHNPHQTNLGQSSRFGNTTEAALTSILAGLTGIGGLVKNNLVISLFILILIGTIIGEKIMKERR